jgi:tRNA (guanine-N7-)-methyltransferase
MEPGPVGLTREDLPPLPDDLSVIPESARLDPRQWFADPERPFEIEIGSGKGTFLIQQSAQEPGVNFLGIEWAREFWLYAADRVRRRAVSNIRLLNDDAVEFLHWRCAGCVVRTIHLYFSDPWPKKRHHRRRVVQDRFLADAHRVLQPAGELRIVTDHEEYWEWMQEHFARWTGREGAADSEPARYELLPFNPPTPADSGELVGTNFERKYRTEGRPFRAAVLRRL